MEFRFTQSARRHHIGRAHAIYAIANAVKVLRSPAPEGSQHRGDRLLFLGDDDRGLPLEVAAIELSTEALLVIHVMVLRDKYRAAYEEGKRP